MTDLAGRTCLITGASSGLGEHFARIAGKAGSKLVLGARRKNRLDALVAELEAAGIEALAVDMDVTDEASVIGAYDAGEARFGTIDTVIANAGISTPGRTTEIAADDFRALFDTNLLGVLLTAREGAKRLIASGSRESGKGRILLIGSIGAIAPVPGEVAYSASKAAVASLCRSLAREWIRQGINVNTIQPGYILTELAAEWFASEGGKAQIASFPRRRLQPIESLDETVLYLLSDSSQHMTGSVITLDDGQSL
jgi:NAD(P)-dependent dehydrogenase (short-subunit alcohol dehydrogenase family)